MHNNLPKRYYFISSYNKANIIKQNKDTAIIYRNYKDKINKEFLSIYKKISKNKKYFFSTKDVILLETFNSDGYKMPKELDISSLTKNFTIPSNINELIDRDEIGMLMLKLVEIIGSDDVENLDPETLYFIVSLLNKAKIKKVRNKILNLTLPLRV